MQYEVMTFIELMGCVVLFIVLFFLCDDCVDRKKYIRAFC